MYYPPGTNLVFITKFLNPFVWQSDTHSHDSRSLNYPVLEGHSKQSFWEGPLHQPEVQLESQTNIKINGLNELTLGLPLHEFDSFSRY